MSVPGFHNGFTDQPLAELPEDGFPMAGDLELLGWPTLTLVGGLPYGGSVLDGGTYIIKRQGDRVLTPTGWHDIDELQEWYD